MPCKIEKNTEHRQITLEEFQKQKGYGDYAKFRQIAKAENFSLIFGGSASVLSSNSIEIFWNIDDVEQYLKDNDCSAELEEVKAKYSSYGEERQKYIAAATRMRTQFFNSYPGLLTRCDREMEYAKKHGYCRSVFGGTRNLIELMLRGKYDEKADSKRLKNLENIAKNYLAQQIEACIRGRAMREMNDWIKANNYKSHIWSEIHDSIDIWVYKEEGNLILPHFKHLLERKIPELEASWVPLPADCDVSDLKKGEYYKGGTSPESHGLISIDGEFTDRDPLGVELSPKFETEYFDKRKEWWSKQGKIDPLARKIFKYRKEKNI